MSDWKEPTPRVLMLLVSLYIHLEESREQSSNKFDIITIETLLNNPDLKSWIASIPDVLKPVKR